jgi:tetratricopeptide (TPR) repeat protein
MRDLLRQQPNNPELLSYLGIALYDQKKLGEAVAAYREATRLQPTYPEAHCNLGHALRDSGRFAGALESLRRGHELGSKRPRWPYPSAQWIRDAERLAELEPRLPALLEGRDKPAGTDEILTLAWMCHLKRRHAAAARFYADAFVAEPKRAEDLQAAHHYNAACAAALAGCGQGEDTADLGDEERAGLREQALAWLRADLDVRTKLVEGGKSAERQTAQGKMRHWQGDANLLGVRHPWSLLRLPADERRPWQTLWADVDDLLQKASKVGM